MEKFKVNDELLGEYQQLLSTGTQIESNVGALTCKIAELTDLRKQIKGELKKWFDKVVEEYKLDSKKDFWVTPDGYVNEKELPKSPEEPSKVGGTVEDLK